MPAWSKDNGSLSEGRGSLRLARFMLLRFLSSSHSIQRPVPESRRKSVWKEADYRHCFKIQVGQCGFVACNRIQPKRRQDKFLGSARRQSARVSAVIHWKCHSDQPPGNLGHVIWEEEQGPQPPGCWVSPQQPDTQVNAAGEEKGSTCMLQPGVHIAAHPLRISLATPGDLGRGWSFPWFIRKDRTKQTFFC